MSEMQVAHPMRNIVFVFVLAVIVILFLDVIRGLRRIRKCVFAVILIRLFVAVVVFIVAAMILLVVIVAAFIAATVIVAEERAIALTAWF